MSERKYPPGFVHLFKDGLAKPAGSRVLVKAVSLAQVYGNTGLDLSMGNLDKRTVPYHEIIAVGSGVDDPDIQPGKLCLFATTAADMADPTQGKECEYTLVPAHHIIAVEM